jgi:hypothetical protein
MVLSPPLSLNQTVALLRLDYVSPGGVHHVTGRTSFENLDRPDFLWSPYSAFTTAYTQPDISTMVSDQYTITPRLTNEARAAYSTDQVGWAQPGQMPALAVITPVSLTLPGSSQVYPFSSFDSSIELLDNLLWTHGRHIITMGAGALLRHLNGFEDFEGNGVYSFTTLAQFLRGTPSSFKTTISRSNLASPTEPVFGGTYANREYFGFLQDSFRATSRLQLNFGLRYENLGAAQSLGPNPTAVLDLGSGANLTQRLQNATLNLSGGPSGYLYQPDNLDFAPRLGFSYDLWRQGTTMLRGGYGVFYDRPFDNLWETARSNNLDFAQFSFSGAAVNYTQPIDQAVLSAYGSQYHLLTTSVPNLTLFQPKLRNGYAQDIFLGIQQRVSRKLSLEVNGLSALGRRLLTNDTLGYNNLFNGSQASAGIPAGQLVTYRANQGISDYYALAIKALYRSGRSLLQVAYTWSHSIDNQSDPLGLDLSNYGFTSGSLLPAVPAQLFAGFTQPMNSNGSRGNSDFDERQNLVVQASFDLPASHSGRLLSILTRNWTVSGVGALRSGFPFSVYTPGGLKGYSYANIVNPALTRASNEPAPGGEFLLNPAGFSGFGQPGEPSGRNAFTGPGFVNLDAGVGRAFSLHGLPESWRLVLRADMFNVLNHANLNSPFPVYVPGSNSTFGLATFGLNAIPSTFPTPLPLGETPRQIELSVRLRF